MSRRTRKYLNSGKWKILSNDAQKIVFINKDNGKKKEILKKCKKLLALSLICASLLSKDAVASDSDTFLNKETTQYCVEIGAQYGICPELLMAIAEAESSGNPKAENGSHKGLMQVSEKWHKDRMERLGVTNIFDIKSNILIATDYLSELFERYEDVGAVLMIYNGDSSFRSSEDLSEYALKILERSAMLERLHGK